MSSHWSSPFYSCLSELWGGVSWMQLAPQVPGRRSTLLRRAPRLPVLLAQVRLTLSTLLISNTRRTRLLLLDRSAALLPAVVACHHLCCAASRLPPPPRDPCCCSQRRRSPASGRCCTGTGRDSPRPWTTAAARTRRRRRRPGAWRSASCRISSTCELHILFICWPCSAL